MGMVEEVLASKSLDGELLPPKHHVDRGVQLQLCECKGKSCH